MTSSLITTRQYYFLYSLLGLVYLTGLFVPLMDNDAAHHATMALRMYLTGDYVNLVDAGGDYLDKPHFLFWSAAASYHIFGVSTFAYKFPSLLFTILGIYSMFRLGKEFYGQEAGKLTALITASAFCILLAANDVRMDAILTGCIAFSSWQLIAYVHHKKIIFLLGASLGLAIGFATKGHVGLATPVIGLLFYILFKKNWALLYDPRWFIVVFLFFFLISPVIYCFYLQYDLHPEKITKGMHGVSGVKYLLWDHSFQRIGGHERFGPAAGKDDHFFFIHTFLWTFAPWCIVACIAFFSRLKNFFKRKEEWFSTGTFFLLALLINFSNFKLPHYMPIVVPAAALFTAAFITRKSTEPRWGKLLFRIQLVACILLLMLASVVNAWAFPLENLWLLAVAIILLAIVFYFLKTKKSGLVPKAVAASVASMVVLFFLLNTNFYPRLIRYQAGKPMADISRHAVDPNRVYFWKHAISSSYNFYTSTNRQEYNDSLPANEKIWILYKASQLPDLEAAGLKVKPLFSVPDFKVTRMNAKFINPKTRNEVLNEMVLAEILERNPN